MTKRGKLSREPPPHAHATRKLTAQSWPFYSKQVISSKNKVDDDYSREKEAGRDNNGGVIGKEKAWKIMNDRRGK